MRSGNFFIRTVLSAILIIFSGVSISEAANIDRQFEDRHIKLGSDIENGLQELAKSVIANNKFALDLQVPKKELPTKDFWDEPIKPEATFNRVWAKNKTIIIGTSGRDKKFTADYILTGDPLYSFGKNKIHAGMNISVIKKLLGPSKSKESNFNTINTYNDKRKISGQINFDPTSFVFLNVYHKNNIITAIEYHNGYAVFARKTTSFAVRKAKEFGLNECSLILE